MTQQEQNNNSSNKHSVYLTEEGHEQTIHVYMTFFYTEENNGHYYLRSRLEKISREEFEAKYAMRDPNRATKKKTNK